MGEFTDDERDALKAQLDEAVAALRDCESLLRSLVGHCEQDWARDLVDQCRHAGAAPFVKQLGSLPVANENDDRRAIFKIRDSAGGDPNEWPEDLRVREFPR